MAEYSESLSGEVIDYPESYSPDMLQGLSRTPARQSLGLTNKDALPFSGVDLWTAYELSWLDGKGAPCVGIAEISVPCNSTNIIESKSLKLYLHSLNEYVFASHNKLVTTLTNDLSKVCGVTIGVELFSVDQYREKGLNSFSGDCLDNIATRSRNSSPNPELLSLADGGAIVEETLYSHLLKSSCPVTGQPDWGSISISYSGLAINRHSLLSYILSYRHHQAFHEHCVERIYMDIDARCHPDRLTIVARYTRRGGIDINPWRSSTGEVPDSFRLSRQ